MPSYCQILPVCCCHQYLGKISLQERELDITRPSHPAPLSKRLHILYFHFVLDSNHDGEISCASQWGGGTCLKGHDVEGERGHSGSHTLSRDLQMETEVHHLATG